MKMPLLRFKSNDGDNYPDWEEDNVGSIGVCIAGATPSTKNKNFWENGTIPWLSSGEVNKRQIFDTDKKITQLGYDNSSTKMVKANSVIIAMAGQGKTRGMTGITRIPLCTNQSLCSIETNDRVIGDYLYQHLLTRYMDLRNLSSGDDTRGGLNLEIIRNFEVVFPASLEEQQKIVHFLSDIDTQIENYQKTLANLEAQKSELLRQVFSQELRFTKEDGSEYPDWEERLISDFAEIQMCKRIYKSQTQETGDIPFYKIGTLGKQADAYIDRHLYEDYKARYRYPKSGEVMLTCSGTIGKCIIFDGHESYYQDSNIIWLRNLDDSVLNKFVYYCILYNSYSTSTTEGVICRLYTKDLTDVSFAFPCLEEQQKIADFFSDFDKRIELERQRLQTMQELKKGLLQQMFC